MAARHHDICLHVHLVRSSEILYPDSHKLHHFRHLIFKQIQNLIDFLRQSVHGDLCNQLNQSNGG